MNFDENNVYVSICVGCMCTSAITRVKMHFKTSDSLYPSDERYTYIKSISARNKSRVFKSQSKFAENRSFHVNIIQLGLQLTLINE